MVYENGSVAWQGVNPFDVAAVESAAREISGPEYLPNGQANPSFSPGNAGLLRALAKLARLEAADGH
jgi:hypothetical protein